MSPTHGRHTSSTEKISATAVAPPAPHGSLTFPGPEDVDPEADRDIDLESETE